MADPPESNSSGLPAQVIAQLQGRVRRLFVRRLRDPVVAEDLTQEVFLKTVAYARDNTLQNPNAFIFTAAMNVLRDHVRRRRVSDQHLRATAAAAEESDDESNVGSVGFDAERVLLGREELRVVMDALDELGERTRTIFILHRVDRVRQREIAGMFGISVSAVEKHIVKATAHLGRRMSSHG